MTNSTESKGVAMKEETEEETTGTGSSNTTNVNSNNNSNNGSNSKMCRWYKPSNEHTTHDVNLYVMNSLTRNKEKLIPMKGKQIYWYMCGPTVYAPSHMGHARTYLGFDIIRRILSEYFSYDVTLIMNITDIDDKIIQRSQENNVTSEQLSRQYEEEFHNDMVQLGVSPPNVLTRVTEYIPEIVEYIRVIVEEKGMAYESNGSVYFDTKAFQKEGYDYCKLAPEQKDNAELLAEGEGKLTQDFLGDKRSSQDFALWKKSRPGEPSWESPWGLGRPGWHIECSVMASHVLSRMGIDQGKMDIHSGGVDLKFPHHDNEMAQAEAHASCKQWVNYFIHSGHLHIKGFKMSKSLKNFITIQQSLEQNTSRQIRMCFLRHKYNAPMDYGDNTMEHAITMERTFNEYFHNVKAVLRNADTKVNQYWTNEEYTFHKSLQECKDLVDNALRDDFDTPKSMSSLADLVKSYNNYIQSKEKNSSNPNTLLVRSASLYVTKMFKIFGLSTTSNADEIGFGSGGDTSGTGAASSGQVDREEILAPVLDALMTFRSNVRESARTKDVSGVLSQCDTFRDDILPPLGVRLEDKSNGTSVWKMDDPMTLMKERDIKKAEQERKVAEKLARQEAEAAKEALNKISPEEYIKSLTLEDGTTKKYSQFNKETGMPTHFHTGEVLTKGQTKTATKEYNAQKKKYDKWKASQETK